MIRLVVARRRCSSFHRPGGLVRLHRRPAEFLDQQAAGEQRLVADHLGRQPEPRAAGEQAVLRVAREQLGRDHATTADRSRSMTMQSCAAVFTSQPRADELVGEPVEQFGMRRAIALRAEILDGLDQAGRRASARAIHRDAGRQRVVGIDQPLREAEPIVRARLRAAAAGGRARRASPSRPACRTRRGSRTYVSRGVGISSITIVGRDALVEVPLALVAERAALSQTRRGLPRRSTVRGSRSAASSVCAGGALRGGMRTMRGDRLGLGEQSASRPASRTRS